MNQDDYNDAYNAGLADGQRLAKASKLMTFERGILAHFIQSNDKQRADILADALADPKTSSPLIHALRWAMDT